MAEHIFNDGSDNYAAAAKHISRAAQFLCPLYDGDVHQIFQPRLIIAVQKGARKDARVLFALYIQVHFQHHFVLGEGTRFIGT